MEAISIVMLIQYGQPVLLLALLALAVWNQKSMNDISQEVNELRKGVIYRDVCDSHIDGINREQDDIKNRIARLETRANGRK